MSAEELKALRQSTCMSQKDFSIAMGLPLRTYENLESGRVDVRQVHMNAAKWAIVEILAQNHPGLIHAPDEIVLTVQRAAGNIE
ncbi:DNA-binding transcriptional regulator [Agrobacterium sp. 10MFCol1.1]|uniref:helix-turn-helix domain-containing protein n=1 Tax=Agrobacterium sp. 10MFCol1.1 TaxID=1150775 RepID=UPI000382BFDB|nr:transcriptional regulator [Agrobacterium sp. 10MFCol1.1]